MYVYIKQGGGVPGDVEAYTTKPETLFRIRTVMKTEDEVRARLKELGFSKIRKRYGHNYEVIISGDSNQSRIWVHIKAQTYQTKRKLERTMGSVEELFSDTFEG